MTCLEAREYLFAFLDNELDAPASMDVQRHLDSCHECAREVEIERAIRRQVATYLEADGDAVSSNEQTLRQAVNFVTSQRRFRLRRSRRWMSAGAIAAVLALTFGLWMLPRDEGRPLGRGQFADLLVNDFEHFLEEGRPLQIEASDGKTVAGWLRERTALAVILPDSLGGRWKLTGGRKCKIAGEPAAFAVYERNGVPASLVAVKAELLSDEAWKEATQSGRTHLVIRRKGHTIVTYRREGLLYAAVSTLPKEELTILVNGYGE